MSLFVLIMLMLGVFTMSIIGTIIGYYCIACMLYKARLRAVQKAQHNLEESLTGLAVDIEVSDDAGNTFTVKSDKNKKEMH